MEKAKRSLIRIERIDGVTVASGLTGDDPDELLAMVGDALAYWLVESPQEWRKARRMMRRVVRDWRPAPRWYDGLRYFVENWRAGVIGAAALTGVIYGASWVAHLVGVV